MNPPPLPSQPQPPPLPRSAGPPVDVGRKPRLFAVALLAFAVLFIVVFFGFRFWQMNRYLKDHPRLAPPGEEEIHQATLLITTNGRGSAHGNSPAAQALAEQLSRQMKTIRETQFRGGDPGSIDVHLTGGEFIVFCRLNPDSCAFLIHAPEMRRYTSSAKDALVRLAYQAAAQTLDAAGQKEVHRLAVATRGDLLFDRIWTGDYRFQDPKPLDHAQEAAQLSMMAPSLNPFFALPQGQNVTPAASAQ